VVGYSRHHRPIRHDRHLAGYGRPFSTWYPTASTWTKRRCWICMQVPGRLGLEAVSRGSSAACFVESNPGVLNVCRDNARSLGVENSCRFERMDVIRYLQSESSRTFTLIFADPPYRDPAVPDMVAGAMTRLAPGGLLVVEHVRGLTFPDVSEQVSTRKYGRTAVTIFTRSESDDGTN